MSFQTNISSKTVENDFFRQVVFTGTKSQLVVMSLNAGEDIGEEVHEHVEQYLFNYSGQGKAVLDGVESDFNPGDVVIVSPGVKHNIINTGTDKLKVYTIYVPTNHIDGRVHKTKADAMADTEDEEFGHKVM